MTLGECLAACLNQTHGDIEVIVVDDGSTDATPEIARSYPARYLRQENAGPAAARNRGAREARGEIMAFTDADCVPRPDWIEALLREFDEGVAGVGGTYGIANPENLLAAVVHEEIAWRHARFGREVDFLGSFNVAYRKSAFEAVGGFDESFTQASAEDNDLAYRLVDAGGVLRFTPKAVVDHYHPERLWPYLRTQFRHGYWRVKLYRKHPGRARRGDHYAGAVDLVAPGLSIALGCLAAALLVGFSLVWAQSRPVYGYLAAVAGIFSLVYLLLRLPTPVRMVLKARRPAFMLFLFVVIARDVARGLGMLAGLGWAGTAMK